MPDFIAVDEIKEYVEEITKETLNSTIGTAGLTPLDKLLSAKILLCGIAREVFHLTNKELGNSFEVSFTEDTPVGVSGYREYIAPVDTGTWEITAIISDADPVTETVRVDTIGTLYVFRYQLIGNTPVFETSTSATFHVPSAVEGVVGYAAGAGGGGGGGDDANYATAGGGGGGGAAALISAPSIKNKDISITTGTGGVGGLSHGGHGTPTVLTGLINCTLGGGRGGNAGGKYTSSGIGGEGGGEGGGNGGGTNTYPARAGLKGMAGYPYAEMISARGAGGGGSYGKGGDGGTKEVTAGAGEKGGGGGGAGNGSTSSALRIGGKGGDGYVVLYEGVVIA